MTIPIYDPTVLPCIVDSINNTQKQTKKYLGGIAVTGAVNIDINIFANSDAELNALYSFWLNDCNYGTEPFLISLPVFGMPYALEAPDILVRFKGDFSADKDSVYWKSNIKLELMGTIDYIIDGNGNFIVSDTGEYTVSDNGSYIPTGNVINSYREVLY